MATASLRYLVVQELDRRVFQRLLHQVADRLGGRRSRLAVRVGESIREVDVLSIGTQFGAVPAHEEPSGSAIEVPPERRQRAHAVGDEQLDAALQLGHQGDAVAAGVLQFEAGAEAGGQGGADLGETEVLLVVGGHCFSADSGGGHNVRSRWYLLPKTPAKGNSVPDFPRFSVVR